MPNKKKTPAQLQREINAVVRGAGEDVDVSRLFGWRPKLEEVVVDVREGRVSRSNGQPLVVSRLESPRGALMIMDGYHRAVEAVLASQARIGARVDEFLPKIERAGGAYREYVDGKVNVAEFVRPDGPARRRRTT